MAKEKGKKSKKSAGSKKPAAKAKASQAVKAKGAKPKKSAKKTAKESDKKATKISKGAKGAKAPKTPKTAIHRAKPAPKPTAPAAAPRRPAPAPSAPRPLPPAAPPPSRPAPLRPAPARVSRESANFEHEPDFIPERPIASQVALTPFLESQKRKLEELRDHILDQMQDVAHDSLRTAAEGTGSAFGQHMGDAGSDAYEKDFALSLLSQEQDALYEINEALKRIETGSYGICEKTGKSIPRERLEAIPWAHYTVEAQAELERQIKGRNRWESNPQFMDAAEAGEEDDDEESEEEQRPKTKEAS